MIDELDRDALEQLRDWAEKAIVRLKYKSDSAALRKAAMSESLGSYASEAMWKLTAPNIAKVRHSTIRMEEANRRGEQSDVQEPLLKQLGLAKDRTRLLEEWLRSLEGEA